MIRCLNRSHSRMENIITRLKRPFIRMKTSAEFIKRTTTMTSIHDLEKTLQSLKLENDSNENGKLTIEACTTKVDINDAPIRIYKRKECLKGAIELIETAENVILIMAFTLDHPEIDEVLCKKIEGGVKVKIIINHGTHLKKFKQLEVAARCEFRVVQGESKEEMYGEKGKQWFGDMHNKVIIVDDNRILHGSYNFTEHATMFNFETCTVMQNNLCAHSFIEEFQYIWNSEYVIERSESEQNNVTV